MRRPPTRILRHSVGGFTLVELVIVLVVLAIMSVYVMMKTGTPADMSVPSQAQKLASDIRQAQTLAYTMGQRMQFSVTAGPNGTYSVSCVATPPSTCNTSNNFSVTLQQNVDLEKASGPNPLYFSSLGQPVDASGVGLNSSPAASYTLTSVSQVTVSVAPLTGFTKVCPPDTCP